MLAVCLGRWGSARTASKADCFVTHTHEVTPKLGAGGLVGQGRPAGPIRASIFSSPTNRSIEHYGHSLPLQRTLWPLSPILDGLYGQVKGNPVFRHQRQTQKELEHPPQQACTKKNYCNPSMLNPKSWISAMKTDKIRADHSKNYKFSRS